MNLQVKTAHAADLAKGHPGAQYRDNNHFQSAVEPEYEMPSKYPPPLIA